MNVTKSYNNCCNADGLDYSKKITAFYDVNPNQWNNAYGSNYVLYDASWWKRNIADPVKAFGKNLAYETKKAVADPKAALKDLGGDIKEVGQKIGKGFENLGYETKKALKDPKAALKDLGGDLKGGFYDVSRGAYLGLIQLNAFNYASRLNWIRVTKPNQYAKIVEKWEKKFQGKKYKLDSAIDTGKGKKPLLAKDGKYDTALGNYHNLVDPVTDTIMAYVGLASSVIIAFKPLFDSDKDQDAPPVSDPPKTDATTYTSYVADLNRIDETNLSLSKKTELKNKLTDAYNKKTYKPTETVEALLKAEGVDVDGDSDYSMWWWIGGGVVLLGGVLTVILLSGNKKK